MKAPRIVSAAVLALVAAPRCSAVTPVQKVLELLQGMVVKAKESKKAEVVQWTAYKQWCSDAELQRQTAVKSANLQIESLKADIEKFDAEVERLQEEIKGHEADIVTFDETVKNATKQRKEQREVYETTHEDYSESEHAIEQALKVLKEQNYKREQTPSLMQKVRQGIRPAAQRALAAFLAESPASSAMALLSEAAPPGEANAYEFQSINIVQMLEELQDKFRDQVTALEKEEMENRHAYETLAQDMASQTAAAKNEIQKKSKGAAENKQASADASAQLGTVTGIRDADETFLEDLHTTCNQKADDFAARQKLRGEEIEALEKAIEIISGDAVAGKAEKHLPALTQLRRALVQLRGGPADASDAMSHRKTAVVYLQKAAGKLGSSILATVASQLEASSGDPFEKVKTLIQQLIDRLKAEAADEAQHKEWCDKELGSNLQTRTTKTEEVEGLHNTIDKLETDIGLLKKEIAELSKGVAQLQKDMKEATELREEERAKNEGTIADAAGAQLAVAEAVKTLKDFYGTAAEATAFAQQQHRAAASQPAAPPIFDAPYQGKQIEGGNVIAFLEVIQSDFARLEQETSTAEQTAQSEYDTFMGDARSDLESKEKDIKLKTKDQGQKEVDLQTARNDLDLAQGELDAALEYYDKLKPSCVGAEPGDSSGYQERVKRREEEIQALKEALEILSGQTIVSGPESLYSSVDGGNRGMDVGITADTTA